jgi:hypothetical protein
VLLRKKIPQAARPVSINILKILMELFKLPHMWTFSVGFVIIFNTATSMIFNKRYMADLNKSALINSILVPIRMFTVSSSGKYILSELHPNYITGFTDGEGS